MRGVRRPVVGVVAGALLAAGVACGGGAEQAGPTRSPSGPPTATASPPTAPATTINPPTVSAPPPTVVPTTPAPPAPSTGVPARLAGVDWERIPTERKVVALTFDGGGNDAGVAAVLATLARERVPATFFVTGNWARVYPEQVRRLAATGDPVGNHSVTHPHFPALTDAQIRTELAGAEAAIRALTGRPAMPLFRFPYGDRTAHAISVVNAAGYVPVRWTVDTLGWKGTSGGISVATVISRVVAGLQPGEIVLMHLGANPDDGSTLDADALPGLIRELRARGYGFVTLRALTG